MTEKALWNQFILPLFKNLTEYKGLVESYPNRDRKARNYTLLSLMSIKTYLNIKKIEDNPTLYIIQRPDVLEF